MSHIFKYEDKSNNPKIKKSFCVFMDILGFSKQIIDNNNSNNEMTLFNKFYSLTKNEISKLNNEGNSAGLHCKVFTDNIVLGYPLHSDDGESEFAFCLWAVQDYQLEMALNGFFVRGGFTIGSLFMDEITVYGKALIDAYSIESNIAVEPRIVLSEEALSLVKSHTEFYSEPHLSPQNSQISVDTDGKGFVNYLQRLEYCNDDSLCIDIDKLITHKESVMKAALSNVSNTKVWQKYYWLCNYHNYFCSHVSNYNGFRSEARIDESFFRREPSKLVNE